MNTEVEQKFTNNCIYIYTYTQGMYKIPRKGRMYVCTYVRNPLSLSFSSDNSDEKKNEQQNVSQQWQKRSKKKNRQEIGRLSSHHAS